MTRKMNIVEGVIHISGGAIEMEEEVNYVAGVPCPMLIAQGLIAIAPVTIPGVDGMMRETTTTQIRGHEKVKRIAGLLLLMHQIHATSLIHNLDFFLRVKQMFFTIPKQNYTTVIIKKNIFSMYQMEKHHIMRFLRNKDK